jgi:hypothetical protein
MTRLLKLIVIIKKPFNNNLKKWSVFHKVVPSGVPLPVLKLSMKTLILVKSILNVNALT